MREEERGGAISREGEGGRGRAREERRSDRPHPWQRAPALGGLPVRRPSAAGVGGVGGLGVPGAAEDPALRQRLVAEWVAQGGRAARVGACVSRLAEERSHGEFGCWGGRPRIDARSSADRRPASTPIPCSTCADVGHGRRAGAARCQLCRPPRGDLDDSHVATAATTAEGPARHSERRAARKHRRCPGAGMVLFILDVRRRCADLVSQCREGCGGPCGRGRRWPPMESR